MRMAAVTAGLAAALAIAPAVHAQNTTMTLGGRTLSVNQSELRALSDLGRARNMSPAFQDRALAEAARVVRGPDAAFVLALYRLEIGQQRRSDVLVGDALAVLIGHRAAPPDKLIGYLALRGGIALRRGDLAAAAADWEQVAAARPGDAQALMNLAQLRGAAGDAPAAIALIRRAIAAAPTQPAPEAQYRQWLSIAVNSRLPAEVPAAAQALVSAYPSQANWRLALDLYRQAETAGGEGEIAVLDLMRGMEVLSQGAEYQRLAQLLLAAGDGTRAGEVLRDGIARGVLRADQPPIPQLLRTAATATTRPVADPAAQSWREAMRLSASGDRAAAETALRRIADASPPHRLYADLARFQLIRMSQGR